MTDFRHWRGGRFDERSAGRPARPVRDDAGVWRDYATGAPCDPPAALPPNATRHLPPNCHPPKTRAGRPEGTAPQVTERL
jgi:hypothetical protein